MIVTTTPSVEGRRVAEYGGIVCGEVIADVHFVKDFMTGMSNSFGGRSNDYGEELIRTRGAALPGMTRRAAAAGVDIDYEVPGANNGMLTVTAPGTAVTLCAK